MPHQQMPTPGLEPGHLAVPDPKTGTASPPPLEDMHASARAREGHAHQSTTDRTTGARVLVDDEPAPEPWQVGA